MVLRWPFEEDRASIHMKCMDEMDWFVSILTSRDDIRTELSKEDRAVLTRKTIVDELYEPSGRNPLGSIMEIFVDVLGLRRGAYEVGNYWRIQWVCHIEFLGPIAEEIILEKLKRVSLKE